MKKARALWIRPRRCLSLSSARRPAGHPHEPSSYRFRYICPCLPLRPRPPCLSAHALARARRRARTAADVGIPVGPLLARVAQMESSTGLPRCRLAHRSASHPCRMLRSRPASLFTRLFTRLFVRPDHRTHIVFSRHWARPPVSVHPSGVRCDQVAGCYSAEPGLDEQLCFADVIALRLTA